MRTQYSSFCGGFTISVDHLVLISPPCLLTPPKSQTSSLKRSKPKHNVPLYLIPALNSPFTRFPKTCMVLQTAASYQTCCLFALNSIFWQSCMCVHMHFCVCMRLYICKPIFFYAAFLLAPMRLFFVWGGGWGCVFSVSVGWLVRREIFFMGLGA